MIHFCRILEHTSMDIKYLKTYEINILRDAVKKGNQFLYHLYESIIMCNSNL